MEKEQALQIIEQVVNITIGKSIFKPEESTTILTALITIKNLLSTPVKEVSEDKAEIPVKKVK